MSDKEITVTATLPEGVEDETIWDLDQKFEFERQARELRAESDRQRQAQQFELRRLQDQQEHDIQMRQEKNAYEASLKGLEHKSASGKREFFRRIVVVLCFSIVASLFVWKFPELLRTNCQEALVMRIGRSNFQEPENLRALACACSKDPAVLKVCLNRGKKLVLKKKK